MLPRVEDGKDIGCGYLSTQCAQNLGSSRVDRHSSTISTNLNMTCSWVVSHTNYHVSSVGNSSERTAYSYGGGHNEEAGVGSVHDLRS